MLHRAQQRLIGAGTTALLLLVLVLALPAPAMAGCPECDQYTLVIPDPRGGGDPAGDPAPVADPAPAPVAPAPIVESAPVVEPANDARPDRPRRDPTMDRVHVAAAPDEPVTLPSTPLEFDSHGTGDALLAGLDPATLALLSCMALIGLAGRAGRRGVGG